MKIRKNRFRKIERSVLILGISLSGIFWASTGLGQTLLNREVETSFSDGVTKSLENNEPNQQLASDSSMNFIEIIPAPVINSLPVSTLARDLLPRDSGIRIKSSQEFWSCSKSVELEDNGQKN